MAAPMSHVGLRHCQSCFTSYNCLLFARYLGFQPCYIPKTILFKLQSPSTSFAQNITNVCLGTEPHNHNGTSFMSWTVASSKKIINSVPSNSLWSKQCISRCLSPGHSLQSLRHVSSHPVFAYRFVERGFHGISQPRCSQKHHRKEEEKGRSRDFISKQKKLKSAFKAKVADISEDIKTVPNLLTLLRMLSAPVLGGLVVYEQFSLAVGLFVMAGITDLMDGYIARNFKNQKSVLGTMMDPLADKLLVTMLTVTLAMVDLIPVPLVTLIIARDVGLIGAAFYIRYLSLPPPKTVSRYFDLTLPTAKLYPSTLSKVNTALQLSLVALTLAAPVFGYVDHNYLHALWYITAATTISSGLQYVLSAKSFFKILQRSSGGEKPFQHKKN